MALFKRAQVSVLLNEPDRAARIARGTRARRRHDAGVDREGAAIHERDDRTDRKRANGFGTSNGIRPVPPGVPPNPRELKLQPRR